MGIIDFVGNKCDRCGNSFTNSFEKCRIIEILLIPYDNCYELLGRQKFYICDKCNKDLAKWFDIEYKEKENDT